MPVEQMNDETLNAGAVLGRPELRLVADAAGGGAAASPSAIRVLVVDDHPMIRDIVRVATADSDRVRVVGEANDGEGALIAVDALRPDVVLLDLDIPGTDSLALARSIRERGKARIVAMAEAEEPEVLFDCRRAGIAGVFQKTEAIEDLLRTVEDVAGGGHAFTDEQDRAANEALGSLVRRARQSYQVAASLTARELEALRCIAEGMTTRQVAGRLGVSERTAESHIARLYKKLGAHTRVQAVVQATRLGLIEHTS